MFKFCMPLNSSQNGVYSNCCWNCSTDNATKWQPKKTKNCMWADSETDTTVLHPVISAKVRVSRITSSWWQPCDLNEIWLTHKEDLLQQTCCTGSMPFLTTNHRFKSCGGPVDIVQGACPSLPPSTVWSHVVVLWILYREHALPYHQAQFEVMWWSCGYCTGSMPFLTTKHSLKSCGGPVDIVQGACPSLPPSTVWSHVVVL